MSIPRHQADCLHFKEPSQSFKPRALALCLPFFASTVFAQTFPAVGSGDAELAKQLANPIADLMNVPLKLNWDTGIGTTDAERSTYTAQPVIPFRLNSEWNVISRTILPYVHAQAPFPGLKSEQGLGDTEQSFFFSPRALTSTGWTVGAGPVLLLPTATDAVTGGEKWGAGPTVAAIKQDRSLTYGALANHIWSFAGTDNRDDISKTYLQPFVSYTTDAATTYTINTESTYDWNANRWTVPINLLVSQLVKFGKQPVSFQGGVRTYAERPQGAPDWGLTFGVTFVYP